MIADAVSTAVFLMGGKKGMEYIDMHENIEAVFITKDKEIILSKNLVDRFIANEEIKKYDYNIIK